MPDDRPATVEAVRTAAEALRTAMHAAHTPGAGMAYVSDTYDALAALTLIGHRLGDLMPKLAAAVDRAAERGWLDGPIPNDFRWDTAAELARSFAHEVEQIHVLLRDATGTLQATQTCVACGLPGVLIDERCIDCRGGEGR